MNKLRLAVSILAILALAGCASIGRQWKNIIGGNSEQPQARSSAPGGPTFTNQPNLPTKDRKYRRVTKENFSEEQAMEDRAGSLWRKEGQGSYLFSQNNLRLIGDVINVDIEGKAEDNLNVKLDLIKKALKRLEAPPPRPAARAPASAVGKVPKPEDKNAPKSSASNQADNGENQNQDNSSSEAKAANLAEKFDAIPCRIVEKNQDGSYRVKGQQTIFIGRHEYRLIVTGNVRPDDISSGMVSSTKMIDSKFDLVASNKEMAR